MKTVLCWLLFAVSAIAQTSPFPGALDSNATLGVPKDQTASPSTTLASNLLSGDVTAQVANAVNIPQWSLITIGSEQMQVCLVSGNTLSFGTASSACPSISGRGLSSTSVVAHASNGGVYVLINAWYFKAASSAIQAIENTLGANLANVAAGPYAVAASYNFAPQTPGGSLIVGSSTVTFTPVPRGVNGTDVGHSLYVSAGTGTAESCLIVGGAGTSGQTSGQIILQCANTHSGAWTVQSATSGGAEASQANPGGAVIYATVGAVPFYGTLTLTAGTAQTISCTGWGTVLTAQTATADMVDLFGSGAQSVTGCVFDSAVTRTGGSAIQLGNGTTTNSVGARITGNKFLNHYQGFYAASGNAWNFQNNLVNASHYDLLLRNLLNGDQGDTVVSGNNFQMFGLSTVAAVKWESGGGLKFADNKIVATVPIGLDVTCTYVNCTGDILITGNSIEAYTTAGIHLGVTGAGTGLGRSIIGHNQIASGNLPAITVSGSVAGIPEVVINGNDLAGGGLVLGANAEYVTFTNNLINMAGNVGVAIDTSGATATSFQVANNTVFGYTPANPYGAYANMLLIAPSTNMAVGSLPASAKAGSSILCAACTAASNPCTAGGVLTTARRVGATWKCD